MANIAGKDVGTNDLMVVGGGVVLFILSFFHWSGNKVCSEGHCVSGFGGLGGVNGWHGFLGFLGLLLIFIGVVWVALRIFTTVQLPKLPVGEAMAVLGVIALGTLLIILRLIIGYHGSVEGHYFSISRGVVLYLATIVALIVTAGAFLRFTAGGGQLSDFKNITSGGDGTPPSAPPAAPAV